MMARGATPLGAGQKARFGNPQVDVLPLIEGAGGRVVSGADQKRGVKRMPAQTVIGTV